MSNSVVLRVVGKTYAIDLTDASSTSVTIAQSGTNDQVNYAAFINPGAKACFVTVSPLATAPAATKAVAGTPGSFFLPAGMTQPVVLAVSPNYFSVTGICASTETTTIYVTPVGNQS